MCERTHGDKASVDPIEMAVTLWNKAFLMAHLELMAEKLKKRMEQAWGPMADRAADAVIESMGKQWQSMLQQAGADRELREKLAGLFSEAEK